MNGHKLLNISSTEVWTIITGLYELNLSIEKVVSRLFGRRLNVLGRYS